MQLTDMDTVLAVAREGVKEAEKDRKERFSRSYGISAAREAELMVAETAPADAISVIGGADEMCIRDRPSSVNLTLSIWITTLQ